MLAQMLRIAISLGFLGKLGFSQLQHHTLPCKPQMSDTCVVRSVKVFIPELTEAETDLSEGRLCKEQLQPGAMTDQTGVPAVLLIPIRRYSNSWE